MSATLAPVLPLQPASNAPENDPESISSTAVFYLNNKTQRGPLQKSVSTLSLFEQLQFNLAVLRENASDPKKKYLTDKQCERFAKRAIKLYGEGIDDLTYDQKIEYAEMGRRFMHELKLKKPEMIERVYKTYETFFESPDYPQTPTAQMEALCFWSTFLVNAGPQTSHALQSARYGARHLGKASVGTRLHHGRSLIQSLEGISPRNIKECYAINRVQSGIVREMEKAFLHSQGASGVHGCVTKQLNYGKFILGRIDPKKANLPRFEALLSNMVVLARFGKSKSPMDCYFREWRAVDLFDFLGERSLKLNSGAVKSLYRRKLVEVAGLVQETFAEKQPESPTQS